ncbi:MAG: hypothetical protein WC744_01030 [Patescibacteria group bacterium]|jgi:hypothetical protein
MIIINKLLTIFPILFYPFVNVVILFLLGFGLTYIILPKFLKPFWLWLSPWTTIITAIFYFVIISQLGFSVTQGIIPYIAFLLFFDLFLIIKIKPTLNFDLKLDLLIMILVIMTLILNMSPLLRRDKILTTISLGNNDVISYTTTGDYLKNNSISKSFKEKTEPSTNVLLNYSYRWGTPIINSFFLTLLNLQGYQYTFTSQIVLFSLFLPLLYVLFRILFNKISLFGSVIVIIFTGFNINLLYILYHDFFGQTLFWGIETLLFIFFYSYFSSQETKNKKINIYDCVLIILTDVLFFSYHEPVVFMFAPLGIFLIFSFFLNRKFVGYYLWALIKVALLSMIIGFSSIVNALIFDFKQAFMGNPNQPIGWQLFRSKIPYANPFEAMGFWSIHNFDPLPTILAVLLSIGVILIIIKGIIKSKYKILTLSYLIIFLIFYYWTAIGQHNFFAYNRALTYTLPFIITLFTIGLISLYEKNKYFWSMIIVILICFELWSAVKLNKRFIQERLSVEKSFISILDLKSKNIKEPIYVESFIKDTIPLWKQIWTGYFLYSNNISSTPTIFDNNQYENKVPDNSLVFISKSTPWFNSLKIIYRDTVWSNDYYTLGHICNIQDCLIKSKYKLDEIEVGKNDFEDSLFINGWNIVEGGTRWANAKESTLRLVTKDIYPTKLSVEALSLSTPQEMMVYLDDKLLETISVGKEWKNYSIPINNFLSLGVHNIKFVFSNGYRPMDVIKGNVDNRTLYVNFKEIKLE